MGCDTSGGWRYEVRKSLSKLLYLCCFKGLVLWMAVQRRRRISWENLKSRYSLTPARLQPHGEWGFSLMGNTSSPRRSRLSWLSRWWVFWSHQQQPQLRLWIRVMVSPTEVDQTYSDKHVTMNTFLNTFLCCLSIKRLKVLSNGRYLI